MPFVGIDPATIQAARAAALARGMPQPVAQMPNAAVPPPVVPRVPPPMVNRAAMGDMEAPEPNSPGKAALGQMPQEITPPSFDEEPSVDLTSDEDPRTTPKYTSFFDRPGATDALTAFGAAMLKAPTFLQGLGDAALAVNAVERENRMPSEAEIARANMKHRIANGTLGSGMEWQAIETVVGDDGNQYTKLFNRRTGEVKLRSDATGEEVDAVGGATRIQNSGTGKDRDLDAAAIDTAYNQVRQSTDNIENYTRLKELVGTAGVGTDLWTQLTRSMAAATGKDIGDVKIADYTEFQKYARTIELDKAMTQRGLGQFTETERQIVREALPNIDSNPEAARKLLDVMIAREERMQAIMDEWEESGLPIGKFRAFVRKKLREYTEDRGSIIDNAKGGKPSVDVDGLSEKARRYLQ
jgi:hypothetical protein